MWILAHRLKRSPINSAAPRPIASLWTLVNNSTVRPLSLFLFSLMGVIACPVASTAGPTLKVNVEEPVLEELMGGCSLRCAFRWSVEVIGEGGKPKPVKTLNDESAQSAWIADPPPRKSGIGVRLRLVFPKKLPKELEGATPIYGLDLINGHWKTEELWKQHGRIRKARLFYNERPLGDITFADSRRWQRVIIPDTFVHSGDSMTLEILEIYPGEGAGMAVSELVLQGAH